jgi:hypothetical protein
MPNRLHSLNVDFVSLVDRAAVRGAADPTQPQRFLLFKAEGATDPKGAPVPTDTIDKAALDPAVRDALEKAEKAAADATAEVEKAAKTAADEKAAREKAEAERDARPPVKKEEEKPAPINKDELPPAVRAALEKAEQAEKAAGERIEKAEKDAAEATTLAKAERDARVTREWIVKAETGELRGLPGAPADTGPVMKALAEAAPEQWAEFQKSVLVPAAAQIKAGDVFKEQGRGGEGPPPESALRKMQEKATELRKSDSGLSQAAAMERVRKENPDLQQALAAELGAGGR